MLDFELVVMIGKLCDGNGLQFLCVDSLRTMCLLKGVNECNFWLYCEFDYRCSLKNAWCGLGKLNWRLNENFVWGGKFEMIMA